MLLFCNPLSFLVGVRKRMPVFLIQVIVTPCVSRLQLEVNFRSCGISFRVHCRVHHVHRGSSTKCKWTDRELRSKIHPRSSNESLRTSRNVLCYTRNQSSATHLSASYVAHLSAQPVGRGRRPVYETCWAALLKGCCFSPPKHVRGMVVQHGENRSEVIP